MKRDTLKLVMGLIIIFVIPTIAFAQYARVYGGARNERAYALSETHGRYVIGGYTESYGFYRRPLLIGVSESHGAFHWGLLGRDTGEIRSIARIPHHHHFVFTGYLRRWDRRHIMVGMTSSAGSFLWGRIYGLEEDDVGNSIIRTRDGGYAVCGLTNFSGPPPHPNIILLKLDAAGHPEWSMVYWFLPHLGDDEGLSIIELPITHPRYAIVGRTQVRDTISYDAFVIALDSFGYPLWARVYDGWRNEEAHSVIAHGDTIIVAGWTNSTWRGDADIFLWALRPLNGWPIWRYTYGKRCEDEKVGDDRCLTLNPRPTRTHPYRYLVSGWTTFTMADADGTDFQYLAVLPNGRLWWARRHPSLIEGAPHLDKAYPCLISRDRIVIAGFSNNNIFTHLEDMHLLRTPLRGLNPRCTERDFLRRGVFPPDSIYPYEWEEADLDEEDFIMDTIRVPSRDVICDRPSPFSQNTGEMEELIDKKVGLRIVPNPTKGLTRVYFNLPKKEKVSLKIYNTLGSVVYHDYAISDKGFFTIKRLPAGIYIIRLSANGYREERKLIVIR